MMPEGNFLLGFCPKSASHPPRETCTPEERPSLQIRVALARPETSLQVDKGEL